MKSLEKESMRPCIFSNVLGVAGEVHILCLRDVLENQKTKNERKRTLTLGFHHYNGNNRNNLGLF